MKFITILILLCSLFSMGHSQTQTWDFQGYAIGSQAPSLGNCPEAYMPEIHKIGSQYFMYYSAKYNNVDAILYATSTDLVTWDLQDTIMTGSNDTTNREYVLGGPRVVKTSTGGYRMFYRCAPKYTQGQEPQYHIRSAISTNGMNFTKEGVRIEILGMQAGSYFTHVGHSAMYHDQSGNVSAILTAKDTTMIQQEPDRLYRAVSFDGGMTFGNFQPLYESCHDPVVVKDSTGQYHAYFTYLNTGFRTASCNDGVNWPATPDTLVLMQGSNVLTESSQPGIADLGAAVGASGTIHLYSNYHATMGAWTDVARYTAAPVAIDNPNTFALSTYPNPSDGTFSVLIPAELRNMDCTLRIIDMTGKTVLERELARGTDKGIAGALQPGVYQVVLSYPGGKRTTKQVVF